jgi:serine/threonine-protein kinase
MPLADGQVYAGYTILRKLGEGGMGMVYLAQHPRLPRRDALKVLPAALTVDDEYRQRFNREADIASTLWHPHIVEVHDRGELDGRLWISMDYVDGTDASSLLQHRYPNGMPPDEVVRITRAVAEALDYAHEQLFLHRDVKPSNILLSHPEEPTERIFLADFGIAKWADDRRRLTATDMAVGTVAYAAPEQLMGENMDGRADQYALAATAFHLLTGAPVFQHTNPAVVISQHLSTPPPAIGTRRPDLRNLGPVFSKALAKAPGERYPTCVAFADALSMQLGIVAAETGATEATAVAIPTSSPRHQARPRRTHKEPTQTQWRLVVALLVIMTVVALTLLILHLL